MAQNLDANANPFGNPSRPESCCIHYRALIKVIKVCQINGKVACREGSVVEPTLGDSPDQGHLTTLEPNSNRAARACALPLATAPCGLSVAARLTRAQPFSAMLCPGPGLQVVKSHGFRKLFGFGAQDPVHGESARESLVSKALEASPWPHWRHSWSQGTSTGCRARRLTPPRLEPSCRR